MPNDALDYRYCSLRLHERHSLTVASLSSLALDCTTSDLPVSRAASEITITYSNPSCPGPHRPNQAVLPSSIALRHLIRCIHTKAHPAESDVRVPRRLEWRAPTNRGSRASTRPWRRMSAGMTSSAPICCGSSMRVGHPSSHERTAHLGGAGTPAGGPGPPSVVLRGGWGHEEAAGCHRAIGGQFRKASRGRCWQPGATRARVDQARLDTSCSRCRSPGAGSVQQYVGRLNRLIRQAEVSIYDTWTPGPGAARGCTPRTAYRLPRAPGYADPPADDLRGQQASRRTHRSNAPARCGGCLRIHRECGARS